MLDTTKYPGEVSDQTFRVKVVEILVFFFKASLGYLGIDMEFYQNIITKGLKENLSLDDRHQ